MPTLIENISQLLTMAGPDRPRAGREMRSVGLVRNGAVLIDEGKIVASGVREVVLSHEKAKDANHRDAGGRVVMPGFVDSHSHPVFAGDRLDDFSKRIEGASYEEIAAQGGGILKTVHAVRGAKEEDLAQGLKRRALRFLECGTTTLEAKSGYGLDWETELKILRAIKRVQGETPLELVPTFLGAHAVPLELEGRSDEYIKRLCEQMIPAVANQSLARFADVFCERGYFSAEQSKRVLETALEAGLGGKIHADQLSQSGGTVVAVQNRAVSADHLDFVSPEGIRSLVGSDTTACLVPGSNYFLGKPYPPARGLIDTGAAVALATDFNPGTCPCWDMRAILSIACTQMKMTPEEVLVASTINGACALGLAKTHGSLEPGKTADLVCFETSDYREIPYYFGGDMVRWTMKRGEYVHVRSAA